MVHKSKAAKSKSSSTVDSGPNRLPAHEVLPVSKIIDADPAKVELVKLNEIGALLWFPAGISESEKNAKIIRAIDLFESIKPTTGIEAMLAAQMVGTHHAALECLRRAMLPKQTFEGRQVSLQQAQRLMALYTQQLAALDRHRGKGHQKITVERVQVEAGGQAIVGHVDAGGQSQLAPSKRQASLKKVQHGEGLSSSNNFKKR